MPAKKKYHHGNLRLACIETGLALINKKGVQSFSLRDVARELGVSHNAPYSHFKSKDELIAAIIEYGYSLFGMQLMGRLTELAVAPVDSRATIRAAAQTYLNFAREQPDYYRLLFNSQVDVEKYPGMKNSGSTHFEAIHGILKQLNKDAGDNLEDTFAGTIFALSAVHGFTSLVIDGRMEFWKNPAPGQDSELPDQVDIDDTLDRVTDLICDALGIPPYP